MHAAHTPGLAKCLVRSGIVIATMASALCAPLRAMASFRCVDEGGHVYVVPRTFGESAGMHCASMADAPTVLSAQPVRAEVRRAVRLSSRRDRGISGAEPCNAARRHGRWAF